MRAAIYVRQSTEHQDSLQAQQEACEKFIAEKGWEPAGVWSDIESGLEAARPGWQALLTEAESKRFQRVVVFKIDRFGREPADSLPAIRDLEKHGVTLVSTSEGDDELVLLILQGVAKRESRNTSQRVQLKMAALARDGRWLSKPPIGFDLVDIPTERMSEAEREREKKPKMLAPNADAPKVRKLFEMYAGGASYTDLREEVVRSGLAENPNFRVGNVLRNPAYIGTVVYNRRGHARFTKRDGHRPEDQWVEAKGAHDAIIDRETWDRVQARVNGHREAQANVTKSDYLLTGQIFCRCGARMHGVQRVVDGKRYFYYRCHARIAPPKTCPMKRVPSGDHLEGLVKDRLRPILEVFSLPQMRAELKRDMKRYIEARIRPRLPKRQAARLQRERTKLQERIVNVARNLADGDIDRETHQTLRREAENRIGEIDRELNGARNGLDAEALFDRVWKAVEGTTWPFTDTPETWRQIIGTMIERVTVGGRDDIEIALVDGWNLVSDAMARIADLEAEKRRLLSARTGQAAR